MIDHEHPRTASRALADAGTEFVNGLGRAVKSVSLYKASHPLVAESLQDEIALLRKVLAAAGADRASLALSGERWYVDDVHVAETPQARGVLQALFAAYGLRRLTFTADLHAFELGALCELAAAALASPAEGDFDDFLAQKGVRHILHEEASAAARAEAAPAPPPTKPEPAAAKTEPRFSGRSFGALLKTLVESAVSDPSERGHIYQDALGLVKEALDRHVQAATAELEVQKRRLSAERDRTEQVLSTVAEGKVVVDKEGKILMMNAAAEELAGRRLSEVAGRHITEGVGGDEGMIAVSRDLELPKDGRLSGDVRVVASGDVERSLKRSLAVVQDDQGRVVGTYAVLPDAVKFKEAQRLQEEFLSRVTHDLKAPLSSISCGLELISERLGAALPREEAGVLSICLRNSEELARMIAEILDFSKIQSGQLSVRAKPGALSPLLREAVEALGPWARSRSLELALEEPDGGLAVEADAGRVVHILSNLLANAIKSTPAGGKVRVAARPGMGEDAGFAVIEVKDTGCGISKENLGRIFEKFVQVDDAGVRREGVGLGLTIVRELVRLHRGRVWVESEVGRGSTFFFTLPLAAPAEPAAPAESAPAQDADVAALSPLGVP